MTLKELLEEAIHNAREDNACDDDADYHMARAIASRIVIVNISRIDRISLSL
jgi:hypothetical protein